MHHFTQILHFTKVKIITIFSISGLRILDPIEKIHKLSTVLFIQLIESGSKTVICVYPRYCWWYKQTVNSQQIVHILFYRYCVDSHRWYERHTAEVCSRMRRVTFSKSELHNIKSNPDSKKIKICNHMIKYITIMLSYTNKHHRPSLKVH